MPPGTWPAFGQATDRSAINAGEQAGSLEARVIDPTVGGEWDSLLAKHPSASAFHSTGWARVLRDSYGHKPVYLFLSKFGKPAALIPIMEVSSPLTGRRGVSLPFSDVCPPLLFGTRGIDSTTKELSALALERGWKYLESRGESEAAVGEYSEPTFLGHSLPLDKAPDDLLLGFTSAVRRNLAKAERSGLKVEIERDMQAVAQFYALHQRTRRRHGAPPQPYRFFENIHRHLIAPGLGFVVSVTNDSRIVAAAVFLTFGENAVYKFGASDERLQQYRANNLVMWGAIKHLCESGARRLHFGRTTPGDEGLRRFKLGWGAKEEPIRYRRLDPNTSIWTDLGPDSASPFRHVFRYLPSAVNVWAGSLLYPFLD